jgi:hypothetical protein
MFVFLTTANHDSTYSLSLLLLSWNQDESLPFIPHPSSPHPYNSISKLVAAPFSMSVSHLSSYHTFV